MERSPVVQEEATGCAIASCAAIAGISYARARQVAGELGISARDPSLWSQTRHVRKLLRKLGFRTRESETRFSSWSSLPDLALLATKWHLEQRVPFWHWAVFVRDADGNARVLDSKASLRTHARTDYGRIRPKWFIAVSQ